MYQTRPPHAHLLRKRLIARSSRAHAIDRYLEDIEQLSLITPDEEQRLATAVRAGDEEALKKLILANVRLVLKIARHYFRRDGLPLEDLIGHGNIGLVLAAKGFHAGKNARFASYAVWWIQREIIRAISSQGHAVYIPAQHGTQLARVKKIRNRLRDELQREPETWELEKELGVSGEAMDVIRWTSKRELSLHESTPGAHTLEEGIGAESWQSPEEIVLEQSRDSLVEAALSILTKQEEEIVRLYFGFGLTKGLTLQEIGRRLGVSRERVWAIKDIALAKLQREMQWRGRDTYS